MEDTFALTLDKETGFLTVSAESDDPELIVALIVAATEATDELMKERQGAGDLMLTEKRYRI